jgi:hypothetical protein
MSLCSEQKLILDGSGRAARELIVARSRDRPKYMNLLCYMLYYTLGSPNYTRLKALTIFAPSNAGIVGSNPIRGMDFCAFILCLCFYLCR